MSKITTEIFKQRGEAIHGYKYDYSESQYVAAKKKIKIICKIHGEFWQTPDNHIFSKNGCPQCKADAQRIDQDEFIGMANKIHFNKYLYPNTIYIDMKTKVKINCLEHGEFEQTPSSHLSGQGCPQCYHDLCRLTKTELLKQLVGVHGNTYDYSKVNYKNNKSEIEIICKTHGSFWQLPYNHINNRNGCPKCVGSVSKLETRWLDVLGIDSANRQKTIKVGERLFFVDAYDPTSNTIYEFYGDYWHGNPALYSSNEVNANNHKTFGELYAKTIEKEKVLKDAGFILVSIWESDFRK